MNPPTYFERAAGIRSRLPYLAPPRAVGRASFAIETESAADDVAFPSPDAPPDESLPLPRVVMSARRHRTAPRGEAPAPEARTEENQRLTARRDQRWVAA